MFKRNEAFMYATLALTIAGMIYCGDFDSLFKAKELKADEIAKEYLESRPSELNGLRGEGKFQPGEHEMPATHDYWIRFQTNAEPVLKLAGEYSSSNSNVIKSSDFFLVRCPDDVESLKDSTELSYLARSKGEHSVDYLLRNKRTGVCFFRSCLGTADHD